MAMMTYRQAVIELQILVGNGTLYSDGADNWTLDNLLDAIDDDLDREEDYVVEYEGITKLDSNGYRISPMVLRRTDMED